MDRRLSVAPRIMLTPTDEGDGYVATVDGSLVNVTGSTAFLLELVEEEAGRTVAAYFEDFKEAATASGYPLARPEFDEHLNALIAHGILVTDAPAAPTRSILALLCAVLGAERRPLTAADDDHLPALFRLARAHRLHGVLAEQIDHTESSPLARAFASVIPFKTAGQIERLRADLLRAFDLLEAAEVRVMLIKGLALSVQVYGSATARTFGDLDLFVAASDVERAYAVLEHDGWTPHGQFARPEETWAWRRAMATLHEMPFYGRDSSIDLHWHLFSHRSMAPQFDALWDTRVTVDVDDRPIATLNAFEALAHSAGHSAQDGWTTLRGLLDVHRLAAREETWQHARRDLRPLEAATVGVALHLFGDVAALGARGQSYRDQAQVHVADVIANACLESATSNPPARPGADLWALVRHGRHGQAKVNDFIRMASASLVPSALARGVESPPVVRELTVLARRARDVVRQVIASR